MPQHDKPTSAKKDIWELLDVLARLVASIAIPVVIALVGSAYNASIKDAENRVRYVELAVAQLRASPTPETAALRSWAVDLLDSQAPVKLPTAAKEQLRTTALSLVVSMTASGNAHSSATATLATGSASGNAIAEEPSQTIRFGSH